MISIPHGYKPATRADIFLAAQERSSAEFIEIGGQLYMDNRWAISRLLDEIVKKVRSIRPN